MSHKINSKKIASQMESIVEKGLQKALLPMQQGDTIYIGFIKIKKHGEGFYVYDKQTNSKLAETFFKNSALAYAKNYCLRKPRIKSILNIDAELEKHYMDTLYYKNTIKKSKNSAAVFAAETRLDITRGKTEKCLAELKRYIFS